MVFLTSTPLITRADVTFWIAVGGFALSVFNAASKWINSHESYRLELIDYAYRSQNVVQFLICVSNLSASPLTLTEISVFGIICERMPKKIYGKPGEWNFRHTAEFPLCIPARSSKFYYLEFVDRHNGFPTLSPEKTVIFETRSTFQRKQKTVLLSSESHYLHTRA